MLAFGREKVPGHAFATMESKLSQRQIASGIRDVRNDEQSGELTPGNYLLYLRNGISRNE
jgi:hypothetical protein